MSEKQLPASSSRDAADNRPNTYGDLNLNSGRSYNTTFEKDTSHPFPHSAASGSGHFNGAQDDFLPRRQGDYSASPSSSSYINVPDSFYSLSSSNTEKPKKINISSPKYANNDIDDIFDISVLNALLPSKKPDAPLTREILRQPLLQSGSVENAKDNVTSENVIAKPDKISSPMYTSDEEQNVEKSV
uniref:Uncharacterized protein n=1 Tax=Panagrolaimus superbus TaxID=310955 RepID=A0A914YYB1_9BILA